MWPQCLAIRKRAKEVDSQHLEDPIENIFILFVLFFSFFLSFVRCVPFIHFVPLWPLSLCYLFLYNTQQTNIHAPGGIQTRNSSKQLATSARLRPRGHRNRQNRTCDLPPCSPVPQPPAAFECLNACRHIELASLHKDHVGWGWSWVVQCRPINGSVMSIDVSQCQ